MRLPSDLLFGKTAPGDKVRLERDIMDDRSAYITRNRASRKPAAAAFLQPRQAMLFRALANNEDETPGDARSAASPRLGSPYVRSEKTPLKAMPSVSVIVCTHNPRSDYLRRVLDALQAQTVPMENWELLIV